MWSWSWLFIQEYNSNTIQTAMTTKNNANTIHICKTRWLHSKNIVFFPIELLITKTWDIPICFTHKKKTLTKNYITPYIVSLKPKNIQHNPTLIIMFSQLLLFRCFNEIKHRLSRPFKLPNLFFKQHVGKLPLKFHWCFTLGLCSSFLYTSSPFVKKARPNVDTPSYKVVP